MSVRHIWVDLHKTNFVACFLAADETQRLETYPLTGDGLARFKRQLRKADELAVEATQNVHYFYDQVKGHVARAWRWWTLTASGSSPSRRRRRTRRTPLRWHAFSSQPEQTRTVTHQVTVMTSLIKMDTKGFSRRFGAVRAGR